MANEWFIYNYIHMIRMQHKLAAVATTAHIVLDAAHDDQQR